jgi:DNA-binding transcriptional LysR family regulator
MRNLTRREADIAIRHVRPDQPDLIARHLGEFGANLYGASAYLDRAGRPRTLREIADHDFVGNADPERLMAPLHAMGVPLRAESFVMSSESGVVVWELLKAGFGLSMQPEVLGEGEPGVERAFPALPSLRFPVWLVSHRELQTSKRIRIVFDHLATSLAELIRGRK